MNNKFYFLRHAEPRIDKALPVSKWILSENGMNLAQELARTNVFDDVDVIVSSDEEKAYQTAKPFAEKLGKSIIRIPELNEVDRGKGGFLNKEEFDETVKLSLKNLDKSFGSWETANHALARFSRKIEEIDSEYENKRILIVSHGCVINLYFAKNLNKLDKVFERWSTNSFCAWGIIKNNEVAKDIVKE